MSSSHVLVVDDEADIRALIQEILSEEGYGVTAAADAVEAREARAEKSFDLILLDIWMPDTDGITLLREWSDGGELNCPVVIMSGHGTVDTAVEATRLGAFDFVEKPLSLAKLLRTVEAALDSGNKQASGTHRMLPSLLAPVGRSEIMQGLREKVQQYAEHDESVLLSGEPGKFLIEVEIDYKAARSKIRIRVSKCKGFIGSSWNPVGRCLCCDQTARFAVIIREGAIPPIVAIVFLQAASPELVEITDRYCVEVMF